MDNAIGKNVYDSDDSSEAEESIRGLSGVNSHSLILYPWVFVDFMDREGPARIRMYGSQNCSLPTGDLWIILGQESGEKLLADVKYVHKFCHVWVFKGCAFAPIRVSAYLSDVSALENEEDLKNTYVAEIGSGKCTFQYNVQQQCM